MWQVERQPTVPFPTQLVDHIDREDSDAASTPWYEERRRNTQRNRLQGQRVRNFGFCENLSPWDLS